MENRVLEVFYGADGKPYKDQERSVLFPVVGNEYQGANDFTHIRFYYQRLCGEDNTLVAVFKNAKGQLGCRPLSTSTDSTRNEKYALLPISDFLTQYKGDIYIALQCYRGDADAITWDSDNNMWVLNTQVPTIRSTANIKMSVNYAPLIVGGGEEDLLTLQILLSFIAEKSNIDDVVIVLGDISQEDLSGYDVGQLFYDNDTHTYYEKTATSPYYTKALSGMGVLGAPNILCRSDDDTRTIAQLHSIYGDSAYIVLRYLGKDYLYFSKKTSSTYTCVAFDIEEQRFYKASGLSGSALPSTMLVPANKIEIASKLWVQNFLTENYVPYSGANADVELGEHYIGAREVQLPNSKIKTDSVDDNATLLDGKFLYDSEHTDYTEDERAVASVKYALEQHIELTTSDGGSFTATQYAYISKHNATIVDKSGKTYRFINEDDNNIYYGCFNGEANISLGATEIRLGSILKVAKVPDNNAYDFVIQEANFEVYSTSQAKSTFANSLTASINNTNYVMTIKLKNANGVDLATQNIDLPLESIVSSATYYDEYTYDGTTYTKVIVITLSTTSVPTIVPVGDLISGLEKEACVEISGSSGTFTQEQMDILALDNAKIKLGGIYYHKWTDSQFIYTACIVENILGTIFNGVLSNIISYNPQTGAYSQETKTISLYDKDQIDTKVGDLQDGIDANAHDIDTLEGDVQDLDEKKANKDGRYETLTAGLSNNFDTKQVMVDESAYNFRPTATMGSVELEVGSPCKVKKIIGGTIVFNQLIENGNFANNDYWSVVSSTLSVSDNVGTFTRTNTTDMLAYHTIGKVVKDHKYLISGEAKSSVGGNLEFSNALGFSTTLVADTWKKFSGIVNENGTYQSIALRMDISGSIGDTLQLKNVQLIDLTQMFGSTIADYIYSLEQANAGSGVAWFKRYFPKEYYAYNSGELVSVKTQGKKITHFNQWDEEWELGTIDGNGENASSNNTIRSKNYIPIAPNTTYYQQYITNIKNNLFYYDANKNFISTEQVRFQNTFTTPSNAHYLRFRVDSAYGTTYNHDICINFHYDGERDGEYEPYNSETYPCDDIDLRGIPQLDENNNLAFDGDEYANDGSGKRNYKESQFSQEQIDTISPSDYYTQLLGVSCYNVNKFTDAKDYGKYNTYAIADKIEFAPYKGSYNGMYIFGEASVGTYLAVLPNMTLEQAKTFLASITIVYELATPTDENSVPFTKVQECDNWGTEEWLAPTTDTRPCEVPVGHETDYLPDLKAKLEVAPNTPNENGVYVMEHNASGNSYTPIATWLANNSYVKQDDLSSGITDITSGVSLQVKRLTRHGNTITLSIVAVNNSGSDIPSSTALFKMPANTYDSGYNIVIPCIVAGNQTFCRVLTSGIVNVNANFDSGSTLYLELTYNIS